MPRKSPSSASSRVDGRRRRRRPQVEHHPEPHPRRDGQHGLRPGRGGRAADQPRPLQPLLPGEAALLPGERRLLHDGLPGRGGDVLQPPDRHRPGRRSGADPRGRPPLGEGRGVQRRRAEHADPGGRRRRARQQLHGGPRLTGAPQPLPRRGASSSTARPRERTLLRAPTTRPWAPTAGGASGATRRSRGTPRRPSPPGSIRPGLRLQRRGAARLADVAPDRRVHRGRRELQPDGRLSSTARTTGTPAAPSSTATARTTSWACSSCGPTSRTPGYWKPDGFHESGRVHIDNHWEWRSGWELHTGMNLTHEGVFEPFEIYPGVVVPRGSYDTHRGPARGHHQPGSAALPRHAGLRGRLLRGQPLQPGGRGARPDRRLVQRLRRLAAQRREPPHRGLRHQPPADALQLLLHHDACTSRPSSSTTT